MSKKNAQFQRLVASSLTTINPSTPENLAVSSAVPLQISLSHLRNDIGAIFAAAKLDVAAA